MRGNGEEEYSYGGGEGKEEEHFKQFVSQSQCNYCDAYDMLLGLIP